MAASSQDLDIGCLDEGAPDAMYYIFDDVAEIFWPGDWSHGNHDAESKVKDRLVARGSQILPDGTRSYLRWYVTPAGPVAFDSESGGFECHAPTEGPVAHVRDVIAEIEAELNEAREALA
jgi:hypothetical protein